MLLNFKSTLTHNLWHCHLTFSHCTYFNIYNKWNITNSVNSKFSNRTAKLISCEPVAHNETNYAFVYFQNSAHFLVFVYSTPSNFLLLITKSPGWMCNSSYCFTIKQVHHFQNINDGNFALNIVGHQHRHKKQPWM